MPLEAGRLKKKFLRRDAGVYCRSNLQLRATFAVSCVPGERLLKTLETAAELDGTYEKELDKYKRGIVDGYIITS